MDRRDGARLIEGDSRQRYFVINSGRTGSSLLCAVLAGAGADFGMPADVSWSADDGAFEQAAITRAAGWFGAARELSAVRPLWPRRWRWDFARHRGKRHLKQALEAAAFVKGPNLDLAVQPAFKLGYRPRIIVSYRSFTVQALSLAQRSAHRDAETLEADYLRCYRNALMWLLLYGGCAIDYDELVDPHRTEWIAPLAAMTGISAEAIGASRQTRARPGAGTPARLPAISAECERLHASLRELAGQLVGPSHVALRSIERQASAAGAPANRGLGRAAPALPESECAAPPRAVPGRRRAGQH